MTDVLKYLAASGLLLAIGGTLGGFFLITVGNNQARPDLASRGSGWILRSLVTGLGITLLSQVPRLLVGRASTPGPSEHPHAGVGNPHLPAELLLWGGASVGALALATAGGLILSRRRTRAAIIRARRAALEADHDAVCAAYGDYLTDVLAWLDRPALQDVEVPQTAALLHAMDAADDARRGDDLDRYRCAVSDLKTAWAAADTHARKTGTRYLSPADRSAVERARTLMARAMDTTRGTDHERRSAYAKARSALDGVLTIPQKAVDALEREHRLALPAKEL